MQQLYWRVGLSRNLGRITGVSVMGAVFAFASATTDITTAHPAAVAAGMRTTFTVAALLILAALATVSVFTPVSSAGATREIWDACGEVLTGKSP